MSTYYIPVEPLMVGGPARFLSVECPKAILGMRKSGRLCTSILKVSRAQLKLKGAYTRSLRAHTPGA